MSNRHLNGVTQSGSSALSDAHMPEQTDTHYEERRDASTSWESDAIDDVSFAPGGGRKWMGAIAKRAIDIQVSATLLILLFPLLVAMGVIVMSDGGHPVFGHQRVGIAGRRFKCLKFRSMVPNSDAVLEHLLATNSQARMEWNREFKLKNDIRVTKFGRVLRKTSLDELPQLWNVLRGEMSLVGPRPIVERELPKYGVNLRYYLAVKPGMTGLWQVSGRNDVDYPTRVALDVQYVKTHSLVLDVSILLRTFKVVFARDGAY